MRGGDLVAALMRTLLYVALVAAVVPMLLPTETVQALGLTRSLPAGATRPVAVVLGVVGAALALWCVIAFAVVGQGTPLPFDPPRRLVIVGPYRSVRNPMAIGVGTALVGSALYYQSRPLLTFTVFFMLVIHLMVVFYEEPTLRRAFGADYEAYCSRVRRWLPGWPIRG